MIVEERDEKLEHVRLMLDMVMMAHTSTGKERTLKEWDFVIKEAGFARYEVRDIDDVQSVIIAYRSQKMEIKGQIEAQKELKIKSQAYLCNLAVAACGGKSIPKCVIVFV